MSVFENWDKAKKEVNVKHLLQTTQIKMKAGLVIGLSCFGIISTTHVFAEEAVSANTEAVVEQKAENAAESDDAKKMQDIAAAETPSDEALPENKPLKELVINHPDNAEATSNEPEAPTSEEAVEAPSLMQEGVKTIGMLTVLLIGFWWVSNWLKKSGKLARMRGGHNNIDCISVYSVGQKEKIALFKVNGEELLLGITQHSIQTLHRFSKDGKEQQSDSDVNKDAHSEAEFAKVLDSAERDASA